MLSFIDQTMISAKLMDSWLDDFNVVHYAMYNGSFSSEYNYYLNFNGSCDDSLISNHLYAIYNEETLIGYLCLNYCKIESKYIYTVNPIVVNPDFQNMGYGKQILNKLIKHHTRSVDEIYCFIDNDNTNAIKLFKSAGFTRYDSKDNIGYYKIVLD